MTNKIKVMWQERHDHIEFYLLVCVYLLAQTAFYFTYA